MFRESNFLSFRAQHIKTLQVGQWLIWGFDPKIKKYGHFEILNLANRQSMNGRRSFIRLVINTDLFKESREL